MTAEYLQFNNNKCLRKVSFDKFNNEHRENEICLHDRLMFEIKQKGKLEKSLTIGSIRKRIRPIKVKKYSIEIILQYILVINRKRL